MFLISPSRISGSVYLKQEIELDLLLSDLLHLKSISKSTFLQANRDIVLLKACRGQIFGGMLHTLQIWHKFLKSLGGVKNKLCRILLGLFELQIRYVPKNWSEFH